jgi:hypothetical protein
MGEVFILILARAIKPERQVQNPYWKPQRTCEREERHSYNLIKSVSLGIRIPSLGFSGWSFVGGSLHGRKAL